MAKNGKRSLRHKYMHAGMLHVKPDLIHKLQIIGIFHDHDVAACLLLLLLYGHCTSPSTSYLISRHMHLYRAGTVVHICAATKLR